MLMNAISEARDFLQAQLCYQMFITPLQLPVEKKYREFAHRACDYFEEKRSEAIHAKFPRHYILHRFAQEGKPNAKKILIAHGWMSRAAYMVRLTHFLHQQGYDVFVLDFPAHGEARGFRLLWTEAVCILKDILNQHGPFYAVIGHSFGGSMLLSTLNLAGQLPDWTLYSPPEKVVLLASPTRMRTPVHSLAKRFKLSGSGYQILRNVIYQQAAIDPRLIRLQKFIEQENKTPFLCIHGDSDTTVDLKESLIFCEKYPHAQLEVLPKGTHISMLMDESVEQIIGEFMIRP